MNKPLQLPTHVNTSKKSFKGGEFRAGKPLWVWRGAAKHLKSLLGEESRHSSGPRSLRQNSRQVAFVVLRLRTVHRIVLSTRRLTWPSWRWPRHTGRARPVGCRWRGHTLRRGKGTAVRVPLNIENVRF